ncbi:MAG: uracil-DNA glycosylase family protein, partial [Terracidiphilus sp.]
MPRLAQQTAASYVPQERSLPVLQDAVHACHGCDLYRNATQAVFVEIESWSRSTKRVKANLMIVGEQPGDHEDKEGHPFVGPAGKLLDKCLEEAGIDRTKVYVTNTVKHFKWEPRARFACTRSRICRRF